MPNLPLPVRWILNIIFFIIYYFVLVFISGFVLWFVLMIIWAYNDSTINSVSEIIALAALPVTCMSIYFRDKFYLLEKKASIKKVETVVQEAVELKDL